MILLAPWCRPLRNGKPHPKNYPWWPELIARLEQRDSGELVQVGAKGDERLVTDCRLGRPLAEVQQLLRACDYWIAVDNFLQHMAHVEVIRGVVLWGQGDPQIFGYPENLNLLKSRSYLRAKPFDIWEAVSCNDEAFHRPERVLEEIDRWALRGSAVL